MGDFTPMIKEIKKEVIVEIPQQKNMRQRRRLKVPADSDEESWLTTYSDCVTLLLCFFVILLSISEPKIDKFEAVTQAMTSGFVTDMIELPFKSLYEDFQVIIDDNAVELDVAAEFTNQGVRLDIGSNALFDPGSAVVKAKAMPLLKEMVLAIKDMDMEDFRVEVQGHTDNIPISSQRYPSNWELSALRAAGVTRILIENGLEKNRMQMGAFADVMPKVPNQDSRGESIPQNQALNRRIVIHVIRTNQP